MNNPLRILQTLALADAFAAALFSLSASQGERAGARCFFGTGDPEFKALGKAITIHRLK